MKNKRVVLTGGCFDILHYGHIHFLKSAKSLGDYLIVALESDVNIRKLKGENRPIHNQTQRRETLEALSFVDEVLVLPDVMKDTDYLQLVIDTNPNIIAVTAGDKILEKKRSHANSINANIIEIPKIEVASSSQIAKLLEIE